MYLIMSFCCHGNSYDALLSYQCDVFTILHYSGYGLLLEVLSYYLEPICAVGHGVAGLCASLTEDTRKKWSFKGYSMTAVRM